MRIEHVALWVKDLEKIKDFYIKYFNATSSELYHNQKTGFRSYFLSFDDNSRLEIMSKPCVSHENIKDSLGFAHISFSLGNKEKVNEYTETFRKDGYKVVSEPRTTGDGHYESVILDSENNLIELTI